MRDRDEWRRPWVDGVAGLPGGSPADSTSPAAASESRSVWDDLTAAASVSSSSSSSSSSSPSPESGAAAAPAFGPVAGPAPGQTTPSTAPSSPSGRRSRGGLLAGTIGGVAGALLMVLALVGLGVLDTDTAGVVGGDTTDVVPPAPPRAPLPDAGAGAAVIPDVADRVLPSVVRINTRGGVDLGGSGALGSGVVYRADGYIITNHHVIENASAVEVLLSDGDRYAAEIVGSDELNDLAVLRIDHDGLTPIDLRPIDEPVRVGETVVAIGSPFGLDATVTSGIISALNRDLRIPTSSEVIPAVIQTDAAINPGNSGGALVDLRGRLVGINTAIVSRTGTNEGVGFAVPVRQAIVSSDQLIEQGFVRYPLLGITGTDINAQVAEAFGLSNRRGAVVETVQSGSGADVGGLRPGDVIVAVDGLPLRSMADLVAEVRRRAPGMTVSFDVLREDGRRTIEAILGERPRS